MTSESKILTVSYGTFSCTLEGFDDPFQTMKAIAEYFRDLAAEDRYFGAEPPQPDAAMLHRIAEREVSRLVDAKVSDGNVVLRQQDGLQQDGLMNPAHADRPSDPAPGRVFGRARPPHDSADGAEDRDSDTTSADATPPSAEPTLQDSIPSGVVAKLARIRLSVDPQPIVAPLADEVLEAISGATDEMDVEGVETSNAGASDVGASDASDDTAKVHTDREVIDRLDALMHAPSEAADDLTEDLAEAVDQSEDAAQSANQDAPVDSWLVETNDAMLLSDTPEAVDLPEMTNPPVEVSSAESDLTTSLADTPENIGADDDAAVDMAAPDTTTDETVAEDIAAEAVAETMDEPAEESAPETASDAVADLSGAVADPGDLLPEDAAETPASIDSALRDDPLTEDMADAPALDAEEALVAALNTPITETDSSVPVAETQPTVQEVVPEDAAPAAQDAAPEAAPAPAAPKVSAKTKRVNSRVVRIHPDDEPDAPAADAADPNSTRMVDRSGDDDFNRLLRQADDVMADEGNRRRQDSIAHLKAAVAATEADRVATGESARPTADAKLDPYRDVLAEVVQPDAEATEAEKPPVKPRRKSVSVRPQEPRPGTIRPGMISPPPLVLVSEQRIDRIDAVAPPASDPGYSPAAAYAPAYAPDADQAEQPRVGLRTGRLTGAIGIGAASASPAMPQQKIVLEQPSRSTAVDLDEEDDLDEELTESAEAGLADFAERVGVKSMADMLEAAAAYATCIEKRAQFTRPQLMRRLVASAGGKPVSREEGLRSFGTLLRTGRIEKISRGQYILAEHSPYLAEARRLN